MAGVNGFRKPHLKGWPFTIGLGLLLAVVALIDRGGLDTPGPTLGCGLRVAVAELNVRSTPDLRLPTVRTLRLGATVDGTTVREGGYRRLADGNWVLERSVTPVPGSVCD